MEASTPESHDCCGMTKTFLIVASLVVIAIKIWRFVYKAYRIRKLRTKKINQTTTSKGKLLQKLIGLKTPIENKDTLTSLPFEEVQRKILDNEIKVIDFLEAFQAKALDVDRKLNCIADVVYDADVTALYLDSIPEKERGRLHGIPLSVQEGISQTEFDSYFGCVSRCSKPEKRTANVVEALTNEGMIPFSRTTANQSDLSIDCKSYLHGETLNPRDTGRTSGGFSGGEGAIIGAGGSMVGIGADISGGIRIPASFCGIFGFKPSSLRVGKGNISLSDYFQKPAACECVVGPMSLSFDLLLDVSKVIFSKTLFDLDGRVPQMSFDEDCFKCDARMTIGFYKSFSDTSLSMASEQAVENAIEKVKSVLKRNGHTLVEWEPPRISYACDLLVRCLYADAGEASYQLSKIDSVSDTFQWITGFPSIAKYLLRPFVGLRNSVLSNYLQKSIGSGSAHNMLKLISEVDVYKNECDKSWRDSNLDAVICPVLPFTPPLTGSASNVVPGILYSCIYNLLDYPAGTVPLSEESIGQPVSVQCVGLNLQDEKVLRLMNEIRLGISE